MKKGIGVFLMIMLAASVSAALEIFGQPSNDRIINIEDPLLVIGGNFTNFTQLLDTPAAYTGDGGKCVAVNAGETDLEFIACTAGGDITDVLGDIFITNGSSTGLVQLIFNGTHNNQTIENLGLLLGFNTTIPDTNASACANGDYLDGDGACYNINDTIDARTNSTTYVVENITTYEGTYDSGNETNTWLPEEGLSYNVSEDAGGSPLLIEMNFTGVTTFDSVIGRIYYDGGQGHNVQLEIFRTDTGVWENYIEFTDATSFVNFYVPVYDPTKHLDGSNVSLRFDHAQNGIATHNFYIDYIALIDGFTALTVSDHDALSGRNEVENHPWALPRSGVKNMTGNLFGNLGINATFDWFFGNINWSNVQNVPENIANNWTNIALTNQTNAVVNITSVEGVANITSNGKINIIPGDIDDYLSFEMESGQPTIKRISGASIFFKSDDASEVFFVVREDTSHRANLVWDKTEDYFYIDSTSYITMKDTTNFDKNVNITRNLNITGNITQVSVVTFWNGSCQITEHLISGTKDIIC